MKDREGNYTEVPGGVWTGGHPTELQHRERAFFINKKIGNMLHEALLKKTSCTKAYPALLDALHLDGEFYTEAQYNPQLRSDYKEASGPAWRVARTLKRLAEKCPCNKKR